MLPRFFAYGHQNYARYMSLHLGEMSKLSKAYPEMYKEFMSVNMFIPQAILTCLWRKCQSYCIRSQCGKATIKHQKSHGEITGYSPLPGTVQRWVLTSYIIAQCELHSENRVLSTPHSETKALRVKCPNADQKLLCIMTFSRSEDIGKSRMKSD